MKKSVCVISGVGPGNGAALSPLDLQKKDIIWHCWRDQAI